MDKKQIDLLNRRQVAQCTVHADAVKAFKGHSRRKRLAHSGQTTNAQNRKKWADGYQTSAAEKLDVATTPMGIPVTTTTKIGAVTMSTTSWATKR